MKPACWAALVTFGWLLQLMAVAVADTGLNPLQGRWVVEAFEFNGASVAEMLRAIRSFEADRYTLTPLSGEATSGTVRVDATQTPWQIDLVMSDRVLRGIYEVSGDVLRLAYALEGDARPTEFASRAGSGVVLTTHRRSP